MIRISSCVHIIAVNGAILLPITFDYWAVQDIEVFQTVIRDYPNWKIDKKPTLWVPDRWLQDIPKYNTDLFDLFNLFDKETFPDQLIEQFAALMPFGRHINWREFTMITAIGLAILKGATLIRIFGADLSGLGYFKPGLENERTIHIEKRWAGERDRLNEVTREAAQHGIVITREQP